MYKVYAPVYGWCFAVWHDCAEESGPGEVGCEEEGVAGYFVDGLGVWEDDYA